MKEKKNKKIKNKKKKQVQRTEQVDHIIFLLVENYINFDNQY